MAAPNLTIGILNSAELAALFSKITIDRSTGCWIWTGCKDGRGYGHFSVPRRLRRPGVNRIQQAHRFTFAWLVRDLPTGRKGWIPVIDHVVCDNPSCCNPAHLALVPTNTDNIRRTGSPWMVNSRRVTCARGHFFDGVDNHGRRKCFTCKKLRAAEYRRSRGVKTWDEWLSVRRGA